MMVALVVVSTYAVGISIKAWAMSIDLKMYQREVDRMSRVNRHLRGGQG